MPEPHYPSALRHPLVSILLTLVIVFLGFQLIGPLIGSLIAYPFFPGTPEQFKDALLNTTQYPEFKIPLLIMQGFGALIGLILIPVLFLRKQGRPAVDLLNKPFYVQPALIVPLIVVAFMGVNAIFIEWNQNIDFPEFFSGFEKWAQTTEEKLEEVTQYLTYYDSTSQFILAFIVIAILPAIGEELVFRGMIQNDFYRATRNVHVSVWIAAIVFSAIHFQFYGFVPRMLLGALFGYLYHWSGNLLMPMLAHFVNNGFTVIALYLHQNGMIAVDIEDPSAVPWQTVVFSALFTVLLLYAYKNFYNRQGIVENIE